MPLPSRANSTPHRTPVEPLSGVQPKAGTIVPYKEEKPLNSANGAPTRVQRSETDSFVLSILSNVPSTESKSLIAAIGRSVGIDFFGCLFSGEVKITPYESGGCKLMIMGGNTTLEKLHPLCVKASECKDFTSVLVRHADYKA